MTCLPLIVKLYCSIKHNKKKKNYVYKFTFMKRNTLLKYRHFNTKKTEVLLHFVKK